MDAAQFVALLSNDDVSNKFREIFGPLVHLIVSELIKPLQASIDMKINELVATVKTLQAECAARKGEIAQLQKKYKDVNDNMEKAEKKLFDLEQYTKRDNLVISGLPATVAEVAGAADAVSTHSRFESSDVTEKTFISFCKDKLNITVDTKDISIAHRIKPKNPGECPPVFVRFVRRSVRDSVFHSKSALRDSNKTLEKHRRVYINEDLVEGNRRLLKAARKMFNDKKIMGAWSSNCVVKVKTFDSVVHSIHNFQDLNDLEELDV